MVIDEGGLDTSGEINDGNSWNKLRNNWEMY